MEISELLINHMENPLGVSDQELLFSWKLTSALPNTKQKRYDLQVALDTNFEKIIWHQNEWSDQSINLLYAGPALSAKTEYFVRVKSLDFSGNESGWSKTATFETGILKENQWQGQWMTPEKSTIDSDDQAIKPFTAAKTFSSTQTLKKARLYVSALGIYTVSINQQRVGADYFTPGWTDYNDRVQYQTYDVTALLEKDNELTIAVAEGWFSGYLGWEKQKNTYGNFNAAIVQLELEYQDGQREIITSDDSWQEISNCWTKADLYNGETQDLNQSQQTIGRMKTLEIAKSILVPQENEPVRQQELLTPVDLFTDNQGKLILDLGQNMVGWVKARVTGTKGQVVTLTHGEILDRDGNFYRANIRDAKQQDQFVLTGGADVLEPNFTFHGFRYVQLENFPANIKKEDFTGVVLHSDMPQTSSFETSDALINQLQHNILWGQKGNFVDVPTDCPQRDERLGWTADAQIFFTTASFNMDTYNFFKKWLKDVSYAQLADGAVPFVVPDVLKGVFADNAAKTTAAWGDAATIIPWEMYQRFGEQTILAESYPMMKRWVDYIRGQGSQEALWDTGLQLGDWLALDADEGSFFGATDETLIATCYFAYSAKLVAQAAKVLGYFQDYKDYQQLHAEVKTKINETYFDEAGRLYSNTQTAHIITLLFGLYPEGKKAPLVRQLVALIKAKDKHLDTGFVGSPYICQVLAENGEIELAYHLLFNEDLPSWLYQVKKGATTVWEHWDGIKTDGSFWDDGMNSFNHYAYGSIGIWMYETIGGIKLKQPGYKQATIAPKPTKKLSYAKVALETQYGRLSSNWQVNNQQLTLTVEIPVNTQAEIILPQVQDKNATEKMLENWQPLQIGRKETTTVDIGIAQFKTHQEESNQAELQTDEIAVLVGSGTYEITYDLTERGE